MVQNKRHIKKFHLVSADKHVRGAVGALLNNAHEVGEVGIVRNGIFYTYIW